MARWFRVYDDLVDDPKVQCLAPEAFKRAFFAAISGQENEFAGLVVAARGRPVGPEWGRLRSAAFERDDYTCRYCGARGGRLECDHVIPVSRGGLDDIENLATACFGCNRSKGDKLVSEWRP